MTTLLTVGNSEGDKRCDAKCYNAKDPKCDCCCGGLNHGVGYAKAAGNVTALAESWIERAKRGETDYRLKEFQGKLPL